VSWLQGNRYRFDQTLKIDGYSTLLTLKAIFAPEIHRFIALFYAQG
jgi:hypothetical protein